MNKPIPTKLFLPKQLFNSLTDWTKANYTSWGWKNASINTKDWQVGDGTVMTQVDSSTFSFRGANQWGSCGTIKVSTLITGVHALVKCPKTTPLIKVLIGATDVSQDHKLIYPTFSDGTYNYFVIDTDEGFSRFYSQENTTDWMDIRFFDPCIVLKSHLKPISVGDKLGLVYWDGTITAGNNFLSVKGYTIQTDAHYLNYYDRGDYKKIRDTAGTTMWFSGAILESVYHDGAWDSSAEATNELLPHLFHVI